MMDRGASRADPLQDAASASQLQLIYETAPIGLAFLSTDCRYILINQHLTEICGISIAEHIGRTVRETVPKVAEQVEQIVQTIVRTGEPITGIEVNGQRPDGSNLDRIWITYWHPLKDEQGTVVGINVAAEEITERKRAEARLAASQATLRKLNETLAERVEQQAQERDRVWQLSQDLIVVSDMNGTILSVNPAVSVILGWSPEDLVNRHFEWLVHRDDRERAYAALSDLTGRQSTIHVENRVLCKDGSFRWLSWRAVPDRGSIYSIGRDITHLKQTQEQLRSLQRELIRSSRQSTLNAMTASIAHEIKQPLAAVVASANAGLRWLDRLDLMEVRQALDRIVSDGRRINEVIASVRAIFGNQARETSDVDIPELIGEVLALVQGDLEAHRITVRSEQRGELPPIQGVRVQLQQVLSNIVTNAIEAMSAVDGRERCLTVTYGLDGQSEVWIAIEDTGAGIDPAHSDLIFDTFFTTKTEGMGLGLSICRSIVEAHGGRLWASRRDPSGAILHVALPSHSESASSVTRLPSLASY
jgi:PAS domain S-box-containing protein